jgi:hypothetical protein
MSLPASISFSSVSHALVLASQLSYFLNFFTDGLIWPIFPHGVLHAPFMLAHVCARYEKK